MQTVSETDIRIGWNQPESAMRPRPDRSRKAKRKLVNGVFCPRCRSDAIYRYGKTANGKKRYLCQVCRRQFSLKPTGSPGESGAACLSGLRKADACLHAQRGYHPFPLRRLPELPNVLRREREAYPTMHSYYHCVPGRMRVKIPALKSQPDRGEEVAAGMEGVSAVTFTAHWKRGGPFDQDRIGPSRSQGVCRTACSILRW